MTIHTDCTHDEHHEEWYTGIAVCEMCCTMDEVYLDNALRWLRSNLSQVEGMEDVLVGERERRGIRLNYRKDGKSWAEMTGPPHQ